MSKEFTLSRRKALAALGTVGAASAGAGLGTSAYFSDRESFENNRLVAGELDMHVAYSAHYSDWSPGEGEGVTVRMWEGPPGTTGGGENLESGETGLPLDDAWLIAVDDPDRFLANTQYAADGAADCDPGTDAEELDQPVIDLGDVKPGDFGEVTFDFALCDNPGYVWLTPSLRSASENGVTEPEADDADEEESEQRPASEDSGTDDVELLDAVQVAAWADDGDNYQDGDESPDFVGSLRQFLSRTATPGVEFTGNMNAEAGGGTGTQGCFSAATTHSIGVAWWLPVDHGNENQSDSAAFDLSLYTEQCRHNDGEGIDCTLDDCTRAFLLDEPTDPLWPGGSQWDGETVASSTVVTVGSRVEINQFGPAPFGFDPVVTCVEAGTTVRWEWLDQNEVNPSFPPDGATVHHNVTIFEFPPDAETCDTSAVDPATFVTSGEPVGHNPPDDPEPEPFEHTFDDPGVYPYYCEPHGSPEAFPDPDPTTDANEALDDYHPPPNVNGFTEPQNLLGMRGAVVVTPERD